jgi:hypothetical protein
LCGLPQFPCGFLQSPYLRCFSRELVSICLVFGSIALQRRSPDDQPLQVFSLSLLERFDVGVPENLPRLSGSFQPARILLTEIFR